MKIRRLEKKYRRARRRRPINVLASVMTTLNLYFGILSIFASIGQEFHNAALYILVGIIFDMLDGVVARITDSASEFGKELDSLADVVTFGVAPGVLVFCSYLPEAITFGAMPRNESIVGKTGSFIAIVFVVCAALRLARFNTYQAGFSDSFVGLPSPAAGGTLASFVLFIHYFEPRLSNNALGPVAYYALGAIAVIIALLMVSRVRYPKSRLKTFILAPRNAFFALGTWAFAIAVVHYAITISWAIVLFPLAAAYVLFGVFDTLYLKFTHRDHEIFDGMGPLELPDYGPDAPEGGGAPSKNEEAL